MLQTNTLLLTNRNNQNLLQINLTLVATLPILQNTLKLTQIMISFRTPYTPQDTLPLDNLLITIITTMMSTNKASFTLTLITKSIMTFTTFI